MRAGAAELPAAVAAGLSAAGAGAFLGAVVSEPFSEPLDVGRAWGKAHALLWWWSVDAVLKEGGSRLTAAIPMDSPYCSCKLTLLLWRVGRGLQLHSLWIIPTVAVRESSCLRCSRRSSHSR